MVAVWQSGRGIDLAVPAVVHEAVAFGVHGAKGSLHQSGMCWSWSTASLFR